MKISIKNNYLLKVIFFSLPLSFCIGQAAVTLVFLCTVLIFLINKNITFLYNDPIKIMLILYFFSLIFGSFFSLNINQSLYSSVTYTRFIIFFSFIHLYENFFIKKIQNKFFLWCFLLSLIIIFDAYYQYFNPLKEDIFGFKADPFNEGRLTSIFKNEYIVGSVLYNLFFTVSIFFIFFLKNKTRVSFYLSKNVFIIFAIVIYLSAIFLSGDRMPFLMTLATFFLVFFFLNNLRLNLFIALVIFLFFFIFQIINNNYFNSRYKIFIKEIYQNEKIENGLSKNRNFLDSQWGAHYLTGFEIFKNNPYYGIGLKQFKIECSSKTYDNIASAYRAGRCSNHPHNLYIEMLAETGILSTLIFIFFILYFFIRCIKIVFNQKIKYYINTYEYVLFVTFFAVNILTFFPLRSSGSFFSNYAGSLIWFNLSFLFIYLKYFETKLER